MGATRSSASLPGSWRNGGCHRRNRNGLPGFLMVDTEGEVETLALAMHEDRIAAIYAVRNPDKLAHLARLV
jgi:hypothetical protein